MYNPYSISLVRSTKVNLIGRISSPGPPPRATSTRRSPNSLHNPSLFYLFVWFSKKKNKSTDGNSGIGPKVVKRRMRNGNLVEFKQDSDPGSVLMHATFLLGPTSTITMDERGNFFYLEYFCLKMFHVVEVYLSEPVGHW